MIAWRHLRGAATDEDQGGPSPRARASPLRAASAHGGARPPRRRRGARRRGCAVAGA